MAGVERARLLQILPRRGDVARRDVLLALLRELLDERTRLQLVARLVAEDAGFVVHQVVGQNLRGDVDDFLKIARR